MTETLETTSSPAATQIQAGDSTSTETESFELSKYIDNDGTLKDGYLELVPEDMRHDLVYKKVSDFKGVLRQLGQLDRTVGKKGVIIPDPKTATPSDIDAFHRALGRPDKSDDYKLDFPEEFKDFYDPETIKQFKEIGFKRGFDQEDMQAIMALKMEMDKRDIEWMEQDQIKEKADCEAALRDKWGTNYDVRLHLANYMIDKNAIPGEQKDKLLEKIGNEPLVGDFLATIARKFVESGSIADVEMTSAMTKGEAESKMKEKITEHQQHSQWKWDNPEGYKREEKEIDDLARMAAS